MNKLNFLKERIKKNFKENKVLLFVFVAIWIAVIIITLSFYKNTLGKQSIGNEGCQNVVELTKTTEVKQEIAVNEIEDTESICIKFATYARNNNGSIFINVNGNDSKKEYLNKTIDVKKLIDNDFVTYSFDELLDETKDKDITITIKSDCEIGKAPGLYYSNDKAFESSDLTINNKTQDGDLSVRFLLNNEDLSIFNSMVIIFTIVCISIFILILLLIKPRYEFIFAYFAIVFGLIFMFIITPMSVPDETVHYEYSFQLSNMIMGEKNYRMFDEEYQNYGSFAGHYNISAAYTRLMKKINKPLGLRNNRVKMNFDVKDSYVGTFIPSALGITLARLLKLNMLKTFYLGRLFNLIFYIACVYICIKKTPIHKLLIGVLSTSPMFIQQAASFSYDCIINGLSLILISLILKWIYKKEKIDIKEYIFGLIVCLLLSPIKVVYGLFAFLFWLVPVNNYGSRKKKIIATLIITAPIMYQSAVLLFPLIYRIIKRIIRVATGVVSLFRNNIIYAESETSVYAYAKTYEAEEIYSFNDVLINPMEAIEIIVRTIRYNIKLWFYGSIGRTLSGNTLVVPINIVHLFLCLLIAISFREEKYVESIAFKLIDIGICVFASLMMIGGMLISWTPITQDIIDAYGGPIVQGIQGRYFCPLLPYFFLLFNNKKLKISSKYDNYLIFGFIIVMFEVIVYILSYTFVN